MRSLRFSRARGAALVEAAVVIPVMVVFLGIVMWMHHAYATKIDRQMATRGGVLFYASHNCEGTPPTSISKSADTSDTGGDQGQAEQVAGNMRASEQAGLKREWNLAKAAPADTFVNGSAVQEGKRHYFSVPIHAESEVGCNEKAYDSGWEGVPQMVKSFGRSGSFP